MARTVPYNRNMNEVLFIAAAVINLIFIAGSVRFGRLGLMLTIAVNLILVSTFAPKLASVFGMV